jgi:hypothetical protein
MPQWTGTLGVDTFICFVILGMAMAPIWYFLIVDRLVNGLAVGTNEIEYWDGGGWSKKAARRYASKVVFWSAVVYLIGVTVVSIAIHTN